MRLLSNRIPLRFGLRTLLAVVAVIAFASLAANWAYRRSVFHTAVFAYQQARAELDTDTVTHAAVCAASEQWLEAELRVPFADPKSARLAHLERVQAIRDKLDSMKNIVMWGEADTPTRILQEIDVYLDSARDGVR